MAAPDTVLLVPGLFSPRWLMWGLKRALERRGLRAPVWDDASVFGSLDSSVARLRRRLDEYEHLAVCTHSFGDWLFRQVAAHDGAANVTSLVSLVPVMTSSVAAKIVQPLGALAPEIAVMASDERAAAALHTPLPIDRLIVWSRIDPWVRRVPAADLPNTREIVVPGAHNTILWQPAVHRLVHAHVTGQRRGNLDR